MNMTNEEMAEQDRKLAAASTRGAAEAILVAYGIHPADAEFQVGIMFGDTKGDVMDITDEGGGK